jgi:hypothetical protein
MRREFQGKTRMIEWYTFSVPSLTNKGCFADANKVPNLHALRFQHVLKRCYVSTYCVIDLKTFLVNRFLSHVRPGFYGYARHTCEKCIVQKKCAMSGYTKL